MKLGFIGGGNMAEAIIKGVLERGVMQPGDMVITDKMPERREVLRQQFPGTIVVDDNLAVVRESNAVLFAVKPQNMKDVLQEIHDVVTPDHLFLSICAGTRTKTIEEGLRRASHPSPRVVRIMPNTPALIGMGMAGICKGENATEADLAIANRVFSAVGEVLFVPESQMDAVTALSGSGPAYVFYVIESLIEAGVEVGFSTAESRKLVLQTVLGAATLACKSDREPAELRRAVTSPGGTTAAGVAVLDRQAVRDDIIACVVAAEGRGRQLGG